MMNRMTATATPMMMRICTALVDMEPRKRLTFISFHLCVTQRVRRAQGILRIYNIPHVLESEGSELQLDHKTKMRTFLTRLAPRRNPCAETAKLSAAMSVNPNTSIKYKPVLSCSESSRSPLSATLVMFSLIMPTVSSICAWMAAVFGFAFDPPDGFEEEPFLGT